MSAADIHRFFVTAPRGLVEPLADELRSLGAGSVSVDYAGCRVRGPLAFGYRICLWSRLASRVLLPLKEIIAKDADALAAAVAEMAWEEHFEPTASIAIDFAGRGMGISHTQYGAQRVKDGIVDRFRDRTGQRPSVDTHDPDVRINAFARGRACQLSLDLSGGGLHRRGYRTEAGVAPLRENLAAAMVLEGGWSSEIEADHVMLDPMCGAGTLVIEAALIACDRAPNLQRPRFGFEAWKGHDAEAWDEVRKEAQERVQTPRRVVAYGFDDDPSMLKIAQANAERAGVGTCVRFAASRCAEVTPPAKARGGLIVTNPPYGERMGDKRAARSAYRELGTVLTERFAGWRASVIATDDALLAAATLVPDRSRAVMQGPLEARIASGMVGPVEGDLINRLRKNAKRLAKWRSKEEIEVYRLYDADLPEYSAAIDVYRDRATVYEYAPPAEIPEDKAATRRLEIAVATAAALEIEAHHVYVKMRKRQRGADQYRREGPTEPVELIVREAGLRFRVDLTTYLDTGLFPDHRRVRAFIESIAKGKDVLNLFAYTGTASVYAARGGANSTTTVDLSATYMDWTVRNFELNKFSSRNHRLVKADVLTWLDEERRSYDLVFCDPPTFSNSKSMQDTWDVQRDHAMLLAKIAKRVRPGGEIVFSTNARKFKLDKDLGGLEVEEITRKTTSPDFARKPLHRAWRLKKT